MAKLKNLKTSKSMNLNMIAKIGYGRLCMREINLSFNIIYYLGNVIVSAPGEA
jgi:hypothetical protein